MPYSTRKEAILNGENLSPLNREEAILSGDNQVVPISVKETKLAEIAANYHDGSSPEWRSLAIGPAASSIGTATITFDVYAYNSYGLFSKTEMEVDSASDQTTFYAPLVGSAAVIYINDFSTGEDAGVLEPTFNYNGLTSIGDGFYKITKDNATAVVGTSSIAQIDPPSNGLPSGDI